MKLILDKKKILVVSKSFYPLRTPRAYRTTELVKEFARTGNEVHLLIPDSEYDYSDFLSQHKIEIHFFGPLKWRTLSSSSHSFFGELKRKFGRLLFLLFDYPNIEILWKLPPALKQFSGFDLLVSIAVPHSIHWAISSVRKKSRPIANIWVADCGDPYMGNKLESIPPPFYYSFFEKRFCEKADYISIPTEGSLAAYYKEFHSKFVIIPQGFSFENIRIIEEYEPDLKLKFAYAGGISPTGIRSLHKIIEFLLSAEHDFEFHVYSQQAKTVLNEFVARAEDKIKCHEPIDRSELIYELSKMDFLINLDNGTILNTPSKLIDYALAQRPILNISAMDPDLILLNQFLKRNYENQYVGPPLENFNIRNVAKKFLLLN
jgi:glycosyltransferase involved in cell wall biosynthesis